MSSALLEAARVNLLNPPRVMSERGVRMLKGASAMLRGDVALAFSSLHATPLEAELKAAGEQAAKSIDDFVVWFEKERLPRADGPFTVGAANLEARYKAEATVHITGGTLYADASETEMYAAVDSLFDKLDRQITKRKEKLTDHHARDAAKSRRR